MKTVFIVQSRIADMLINADCFENGYAAKACGDDLAKCAKACAIDQRINEEGLLRITWYDTNRQPLIRIQEMEIQYKYEH